MNLIIDLLLKQDRLNTITIPKWKTKGLNFRRAIRQECAEAIDSTDWKWWKKGEVDEENLKIEAIDILHFALSVFIMEDSSLNSVGLEELLSGEKYVGVNDLQKHIEVVIKDSFKESASILLLDALQLCSMVGFTEKTLFQKYSTKYLLNVFRQQNGYKDGTYIKEWLLNGKKVEDNVVLTKCAKEVSESDNFEEDLLLKVCEAYTETKEAYEKAKGDQQ